MKGRFLQKNTYITLWGFCIILYTYQYIIRSVVPSVFNEDLQYFFAINSTETGSLIGLFYLSYMLMQIPVGILIDRFNEKAICITSFCLVAFFTILFIYTNNYIIAAFSRLLLGCTCSFAFVLTMKVSSDYFPKEKVALFSSIAVSIGGLGLILSNMLLAHLSKIFYWRAVVIGIGIFGFVFAALGMFMIREEKLPKIARDHGEPANILTDLKIVLLNTQCLWLGLFSMAILGPMSTFCDAWGLSFLKQCYDLDKGKASFLISIVYFAGIFGAPLVATTAEKLQSYKKIMIHGTVLLIVLFSTVIFVKMPFALLVVLLFLTGAVATCQLLAFPMAISNVSQTNSATAVSVVNTLAAVGGTVLIPAVGKIMDFSKDTNSITHLDGYSTRDYKIGFCILIICLIMALCSTIFIKDEFSREN